MAAVGDPALAAVDDVLVAVEARLGLHVGRGRAGVRLGDADRHRDLAADRRAAGRTCLLLLGAEELDDAASGRCWSRRPGTRRAGTPSPAPRCTISASSSVPPWPPYSSGRARPRKPSSARRLTSSLGQRGAVAVPLGRLAARRPRGRPRAASSRSSCCSGVSSKTGHGVPPNSRTEVWCCGYG